MTIEQALPGFRRVQRLAYDSVLEVEQQLRPGMTEKEAAALLGLAVRVRGGRQGFHAPFAWFGDRTTFRGFSSVSDFMPGARRLEPGMAVILDVAPALDGYTADIGYTLAFGENPVVDRALVDLEQFRALVLTEVLAGRTLKEVYAAVDVLLRELRYDNCHSVYPFGVLAHKVGRLHLSRLPLRVLGLGFESAAGTILGLMRARVWRSQRGHTPIWSGHPKGDAPPSPGLWAIEPHLGSGDVGAKFEELLVVTDSTAYWLDDEVPHVQRWQAARAPLPISAGA